MGLNIKNERVHALAREAARLTGRTQTGAIEEALELLLREFGADPAGAAVRKRVEAVHGIALEYAADPGNAKPEVRAIDDLYDGQVLPL
ncbi:type II toxin-antitoxin system VapB family antitoxin [Nocardioides acrostichi]|uniref:Type II toxin-antitoxin system VapB family antitoxin n=1 Tax=Nocardioides acrostichi TaxID=2784339 RepID=A0A930UY13_9ACTN|nr:type II toxin-antitoxin system VapB family antitoxin [Nocardioides acrostichi]MBF4160187.1 type II toxin-antitoxin system VapB family antitoxin [Nocardioides acrostichi]